MSVPGGNGAAVHGVVRMGWPRLHQVWLAEAAPGLAVGDIVAIFGLKLC